MSRFTSLNKYRVFLTTIVIFILLTLIMSSINIYNLSRENQIKLDQLVKNEKSLLDSEGQILSFRINNTIGDLSYLASEFEIEKANNNQNADIAREWQIFADNKHLYDQIRYIDQNGNEKIRINFAQNGSVIVPDSGLQNKKDRYYFTETAKLDKGQIYISKLDLNVENNQVEKPDKPMIRLATPVFDRNNDFQGIIILNYYGKYLLDVFDNLSSSSDGNTFLLNPEGYWIYNNLDQSLEWSFMYGDRKDLSFRNQFPNEWNAMQSADNGAFKTNQGYFIYRKITPVQQETTDISRQKASFVLGESNWILVSFIPGNGALGYLVNFSFSQYFDFIVVKRWGVLLTLLLASFAIALLYQISQKANAEFRESEERFRLLFENSLDALFITDPAGIIIAANPSAESMFGYSETELLKLGRIGTVDLTDPRLPILLKERERTGFLRGELNFKRRDGSVFPGETVSTSYVDSHGQERTSTVIRDLSEKKIAEELLEKERVLLNTTLSTVGVGIIVTDKSGKIVLMNPLAEQYTDWKMQEAVSEDFSQVFTPVNLQTREPIPDPVRYVLETGNNLDSPPDSGIILRDGTEKYIAGNANAILTPGGEITGVVVSFRDITKEYSLEKQIEGFLNVNLDMLCVGDNEGNFHKVNKKFEAVLGYKTEEIEGQNFMSFVHPDDVQSTLDALNVLGANESVIGFINRYRCKDGSYKYIEWNTLPGVGKYLYSSARDVTPQRQLEEQLREKAVKDDLTGLFNRYYFETMITGQMQHSDRYNEPLSMLLLDLDHFKQVNDTWGHPIGDELLKLTAQTITKTIRESDILIRFGGEEFAVLMPRTALDGALNVAEKIRAAIESSPMHGIGVRTASIGLAERMFTESFRHWYKRIDESLYQAKNTGRNRVVASDGNEKLPLTSWHLDWRNEWESGHDEIDQQHRELLNVGNRLINLSLETKDQQEILQQLDLLLDHIVRHFYFEEKLLESIGYPEQKQHSEIHKDLVAKAMKLKSSYENGKIKASAFFSFIIDDVILGHLIEEDTKFFGYIKSV